MHPSYDIAEVAVKANADRICKSIHPSEKPVTS